jgi:hypothetical protein
MAAKGEVGAPTTKLVKSAPVLVITLFL